VSNQLRVAIDYTHQKGYLPENTYETTSNPVAREERECESTTIHNKGTIIIDPL